MPDSDDKLEELTQKVAALAEEILSIKKQAFYCVCEFCGHHEPRGRVELNFRDQSVFYVCANTECKRMNKMILKAEVAKPYPKGRAGLR